MLGGAFIVFCGEDFQLVYLISSLAKQYLVTFRYYPGDRYPLCPRDILITSVDAMTTFKDLCEEVRDMCGLHQQHPLTLKWVDSEGSLSLGTVSLSSAGLWLGILSYKLNS